MVCGRAGRGVLVPVGGRIGLDVSMLAVDLVETTLDLLAPDEESCVEIFGVD